MSVIEQRQGNGANLARDSIRSFFGAYMKEARAQGLQRDLLRRDMFLSIVPILLFLVQIPLFYASNLQINWTAILTLSGACAFTFTLSQIFLRRLKDPVVATIIASFGQLAVGAVSLIGVSYAGAGLNLPLWDSSYASLDTALGLDWKSYARFLMADREGVLVGAHAYLMLNRQILLVGFVAAISLRFRAYQTFMVAFLITAGVTIVIASLFPAFGTFHHNGMTEEMRAGLIIGSFDHVQQLEAVRAGTFFDPYSAPCGIVTFPSFHAASGVMLAWFFWQVPYLRWPFLAINLAMIAVTPLFGAHYFCDVFAGIIIALFSLYLAQRITRVRPVTQASP